MQQKATQMQSDLQSAAPQRLEEEGLVPDATGLFAIPCPICRYVMEMDVCPENVSTYLLFCCKCCVKQVGLLSSRCTASTVYHTASSNGTPKTGFCITVVC